MTFTKIPSNYTFQKILKNTFLNKLSECIREINNQLSQFNYFTSLHNKIYYSYF